MSRHRRDNTKTIDHPGALATIEQYIKSNKTTVTLCCILYAAVICSWIAYLNHIGGVRTRPAPGAHFLHGLICAVLLLPTLAWGILCSLGTINAMGALKKSLGILLLPYYVAVFGFFNAPVIYLGVTILTKWRFIKV